MSAREILLARVLSTRKVQGAVVVLQGNETETQARLYHAWNLEQKPVTVATGLNTWQEAKHAVAKVPEDLVIVTSAYHQLRAYLTFLQALRCMGMDRVTRLWNHCAPSWMTRLEEEFAKIEAYQEKGHVASYRHGLEYLDWLDGQ